jgi:glycosyltransferase involved in cell wall biosynthesis
VPTLAPPAARRLALADLSAGPGLAPTPDGWEATAPNVRFAADTPLEPGWYRVRLAVTSASRFTVHKRCDLVFDGADSNPRPAGRETFSWNRSFDETFVLRLTRPARGVRLDLHRAEGPFALDEFAVTWVPKHQAYWMGAREKLRLIRAYQCTRPVLLKGGKLLATGRFRQFGTKVLKGLVDSRAIRLGTASADEVDAAWWRRHTLSAEEAEKVATACDAMADPPAIAVVLPVHPLRLDRARLAAHSIRRQIYPHWELHLVGAGPAGFGPHLDHLIGHDPRVRSTRVPTWAGLSTAVAKAVGGTECSHVVVLPATVELAEHALYHFAEAILANPKLESVGAKVYEVWGKDETPSPFSDASQKRSPDDDAEEDAAPVAQKETDEPVPPAVWMAPVKRVAESIPWRLSRNGIAAWAADRIAGSVVLDPVLAFPVDDRPLLDRARVGRKPAGKGTKLFLSADLKGITGYDHLTFALLKGLPSSGADLRRHPVGQFRADLLPLDALPPVEKWTPGAKQLIISPPFLAHRFTPDKASAISTMWETDRLEPKWVEVLNRCGLVVVPSRWSVDCFRACGVTSAMEVAPLGYDPLVFHPGNVKPPEVCTFGTAGALAAGGLRKNAQMLIDLFRRAFPTEQDVRLKVKITPSSPAVETFDDPRIDVIRAVLPHGEVADWYRSLTAYVNASAGEGFGLHLLEAMACGRPLVSPCYSGLTAFFDPGVGYAVDYKLVPVGNAIYSGNWAEPSEASLIGRMREVYADRAGAARLGERAAARATNFTWKAAGRALAAALRKHGYLE